MNPTRRDWLGFIGATAAVATLVDCTPAASPGTYAMVFEPSTTSFIVSVWAGAKPSVMIAIHTGGELVMVAPLELGASSHTGALEVTGLLPDTAYEVRIASGDDPEPAPIAVRTAPRDDDARPVTIAVGADVDPNPEFDSDIFASIADAAPEVFVSLGDFPYTDNGPDVAKTVEAYRDRHLDLRRMPRLKELVETTALRAIYDDHEFHNDWDRPFVTDEPERYAAALQVWDEFFPLRATGDVRYRAWRWGRNLECFLLDCRRFRGANMAPDGPDKTMLGATQLAWLVASLRASTATFKLVLTSVPLDFGVGVDHWAGYTHERDTLFATIAAMGITGIVFVSADQHWFAAHRHAYGLREFQVGPLARGLGTPGEEAPGVLFRSVEYNFGLVEVTETMLTVTGVGADGTRFYREQLSVADLTPA